MKQKLMGKQAREPQLDHNYSGKFSDHQLYGNNYKGRRYGIIQHDSLNNYQNFLYNRALFGLAVYSPEEVKAMRPDKRKRIMKVNKRAREILNIWKQQVVNAWSTQLFLCLFPNAPITKTLVETTTDTDSEYVNKMSLKDLRITKAQIISKLVAEKVLPPDFYTLKPQTACK
jgi:hypothetical protein